jgi:hypothetical protein
MLLINKTYSRPLRTFQLLKSGILTPVLKKNKDRRNPLNYRGIAVTKIFTKILQSILKDRIDKKLK